MRFKNPEEKPERESIKMTISANGGLRLLGAKVINLRTKVMLLIQVR